MMRRDHRRAGQRSGQCYPDWRVASVDTTARRVLRWIDLRVAGQPRGTRPVGIAISSNAAIYPRPYAVVANQYANFASIIDNIHEPGVISEITVDNEGPFTRLGNDYFFKEFNPPQDLGGRQNISSRNTKHLRAFWDSVPRWLHHGDAHTIREILLTPDSPLLQPGERGFNFRTVRTDHSRVVGFDFLGGPPIRLPTEVPITFADSSDTGNRKTAAHPDSSDGLPAGAGDAYDWPLLIVFAANMSRRPA